MSRIKQKKQPKKHRKVIRKKRPKPPVTSVKISREVYTIFKKFCYSRKPKTFMSSTLEIAIVRYINDQTENEKL